MVVRDEFLDCFHRVEDVINRVPKLGYLAAYAKQAVRDKLIEHKKYITTYGDDMPDIRDWKWPVAWNRMPQGPEAIAMATERRPDGHVILCWNRRLLVAEVRPLTGSLGTEETRLAHGRDWLSLYPVSRPTDLGIMALQ